MVCTASDADCTATPEMSRAIKGLMTTGMPAAKQGRNNKCCVSRRMSVLLRQGVYMRCADPALPITTTTRGANELGDAMVPKKTLW